jgi:hypothetical protein
MRNNVALASSLVLALALEPGDRLSGRQNPAWSGRHRPQFDAFLASMAGEVLSYVQGESLKGSAAVSRRFLNSPATSRTGGRFALLGERMEPHDYSVVADALSKFQTSSEWIQALCLIALSATVLGPVYFLKEIVVAFLRREKALPGRLLLSVHRGEDGRLLVYGHRHDWPGDAPSGFGSSGRPGDDGISPPIHS